MKHKCPYCGEELRGKIVIPPMTSRQRRIYNAVASSGSDGIPPEALLKNMYVRGKNPTPGAGTVLRVQIHTINHLICTLNQRITGNKRGTYRLVLINEDQQS